VVRDRDSPRPAAPGRGVLNRLADIVVARPRRILAIWLAIVGVLAIAGIGLEQRLSTPAIYVVGTLSNHEHDLVVREFGDEDALVVMVRGPRAVVERQGRQLAAALAAVPRTRVVSPWSANSAVGGLRPSPNAAAIVVDVGRKPGQLYTDILPPVRQTVARVVRAPAEADLSGSPMVAQAMHDAAFDAAAAGELIAMPILLLVLLLVFRSLLAAAIPAMIGGTIVLASRGTISLLDGTVQFDSLAAGLAAMMGLGLGVDYSLLVVSRFREELRKTDDVAAAVRATVATTGHAVTLAGFALLLTMLVAAQLLPGAIIVSAACAIITASLLSVLSAIFVVPAILMVLGPNLDRWSLQRSIDREPLASRWSRRLTRTPEIALNAVLLLLLVGTALAFTLRTGPSSVGLLPPHDPSRLQYETVSRLLGPGWGGPLEVLVDDPAHPVTEARRLRAIVGFERAIRRDPGVAQVAGLGRIGRSVAPLRQFPRQLHAIGRGQHSLVRLDDGVGQARTGASQLASGLSSAAAGAGDLSSATDRTRSGADRLASGLRASATGSSRLVDGMDRAAGGSEQLARASGQARSGAQRLRAGLAQASAAAATVPNTAEVLRNDMTSGKGALQQVSNAVGSAESQLATAWAALRRMSAGRSDPQYQAALQAVQAASASVTGVDPASGDSASGAQGIAAGVTDARSQFDLGLYLGSRMRQGGASAQAGIDRLAHGAEQLDRGLGRLGAGAARVAGGLAQLREGGAQLAPGLRRLTDGAGALSAGLGQVQAGAGRLATGLGSGASNSGTLVQGLGRIQSGVGRQRRALSSSGPQLARLRRQSPGMFRSGYFTLASIDGAPPEVRRQAGFVLNVDRGGHAARLLVVPTTGPLSSVTRATQRRIEARGKALARLTGSEVVVGGPAAALQDYNDAMRSRVPLVVVLLSLITMLVLVPVIRSLVLPFVAALLNVLTVGATFGVLALLFNHQALGGPGFIDTIGVGTTITVIFGLSIDYEVFVLARMREEYLRSRMTDTAVTEGVRHTARVIGGAATIMIAVFCAFAISQFASIRDFGVGLAVAVFIDAFLVRLIALPAVMRLLGDRCWWIPRWLDRLLPARPALAAEQAAPA
jgi:putative drug exporter of the RND superfamily